VIRVKVVRATVGTGGVLAVGEVIDLPDGEARMLMALGKAVPALAPLDDAAPVPQHADPAAKRARGQR
jgi:hypothetical protein